MMISELKAHAGHVTPAQSQFAAIGNERKQSVRKCSRQADRYVMSATRIAVYVMSAMRIAGFLLSERPRL
jgi:hypothetical protein